jgi:hypothetical protein
MPIAAARDVKPKRKEKKKNSSRVPRSFQGRYEEPRQKKKDESREERREETSRQVLIISLDAAADQQSASPCRRESTRSATVKSG